DNKTLGKFSLAGIPPASRGVPQIEVKFDIDANGILHVSATDKATNTSQKITITSSTGLSKEEVERMKKDAETHAEEDKKKREQIEHKNLADTMIYTTEKMLKEAGDKVTAEEKAEVEEKLTALKAVKDGDDHQAIKKAADELTNVAQKIGAKMYQAQPDAATPPGTTSDEPKKDEPVDAEFKEKKSE
ncbi:MAG: Hsp70 family protein, partial [Patescibacteria group bacterium]